MRRITLLTLAALALPIAARAQSPQSEPRAVAPPAYYQAPPPVYAAPAVRHEAPAPAPLVTAQPRALSPAAVAYAVQWAEPLLFKLGRHLVGKHPARPRLVPVPAGDGAVQVGYQSSRLVAAPPAPAVYYPAEPAPPVYYQEPQARAIEAPPKAPTPRALPAAQAPAKDPGGIEAAEDEPEWAARLAKRLDTIERRLDSIEGADDGTDRAPAPPRAPAKDE